MKKSEAQCLGAMFRDFMIEMNRWRVGMNNLGKHHSDCAVLHHPGTTCRLDNLKCLEQVYLVEDDD